MGKSANVTFLTNTRIQKEQLQLCKIQNELEKVLGKVNEAINELKVEELQLKAGVAATLSKKYCSTPLDSVCAQVHPSTSSSASLALIQSPQRLETNLIRNTDDNAPLDSAVINQQIIDLNMQIGKNGEEEEEDEDM